MAHWARWMTGVVVTVAMAASAEAQYGGGSTAGPPETISDNGAVVQAKKAVKAAVIDLHKSEEALAAVVARLRGPFETMGPWVDAAAAQKQARADLEAAKKVTLERLKSDPNYKAAAQARDDAERDRIAVHTDDKARPEDRVKAAKAVLDTNKVVLKIEADAEAADPGVVAAQSKLASASAKVAEQNAKLDQLLHADKDWIKANKDVEAKKQKLSDANDAVAAALKQEEDATMKAR